jgi:MFS family permease
MMLENTSSLAKAQWRMLWLLVISALVNYIDRGTLSVAAPTLKGELGFTPVQLGYLLSAFFWTYAISQVVAGWLVDRFNVSAIYVLGFFTWSVAMLLTGFGRTFAWLFAMRLLLGLGESVAYPAYACILVRNFPESRRGIVNAFIDAATKSGPGVGTFFGAMIIAAWGWRVMFWGIGALSFVWIPFWLRRPRPELHHKMNPNGLEISAILRRREPWVTFLALFCFNYAYFFLLTWLPSYLVMQRHFSMHMMAIFGALPFVLCAGASITAGWLSDMWIVRGVPSSRVRKAVVVSGLLLCAGSLLASARAPDAIAMGLLMLAFCAIGIFTSNVWVITQDLAGPEAAGKWTGLQNAMGNFGSVVAPIATGFLVTASGGDFFIAFVAASAALIVAAGLYSFGLGKIELLIWEKDRST